MRLKLDENLPERLVPILAEMGHDVDTVVREGLRGRNDDDLWPEVQKAERFLITKDLGFSDERRYPPGTHQGSWWCGSRTIGAVLWLTDWHQSSGRNLSTPGSAAW